MGDGLGLNAYFGIGFQSSEGVVQTGSVHWFRAVSDTLGEQIAVLESQALQNRYAEPQARQGLRTIAGELVVEAGPFELGALLHAALGKTVTTSGTGIKTHLITETASAFTIRKALQPFTVFKYTDQGTGFQLQDCNANELALTFANGEFVKATLSVVGGVFSHAAILTPSYTAEPINQPFDFSTFSAQIGGTAYDYHSNLELKISNNLEARHTLNGKVYPSRLKRTGYRQVRISSTMEWEDLTQYDAWRAATKQTFAAHVFQNSNRLTILGGSLRWDEFPTPVGGPGPLEVSAAGRLEYNVGSANVLQVTVLANSQTWSTYGNGSVA